MTSPLLLFTLVAYLSINPSISTTIEIFLGAATAPPLALHCPPNDPPPTCAVHLCATHNLHHTIEGLSCIEILTDAFMDKRKTEDNLLGLPQPAIFMDLPADQPLFIKLEFPITTPRAFCDHHRVPRVSCDLIAASLAELFSPYDPPPATSFYYPVYVNDELTLNFDGGTIAFRAHYDAQTVTTRVCLTMFETIDLCDKDYVNGVVTAAIESFYNTPQPSLLSMPTLLFNGPVDVNAFTAPNFPLLLFDNIPTHTSAAMYCATVHCPDRINSINSVAKGMANIPKARGSMFDNPTWFDRKTLADPALDGKVVLSLSSLPSRLKHLPRVLKKLLDQTVKVDKIVINLPAFSTREQKPYTLPAELTAFLSELPSDAARIVHLNHCITDYGPATKLIPTLLAEQSNPATLVITVDDDLEYPPFFVAAMVQNARRYVNAAFGLKGYRMNGGVHHDDFEYFESLSIDADTSVDVLGGFVGVAYRVGFFDIGRLTDYRNYPAGAFFVDDDWIGSVLADGGVEKIVLSNRSAYELAYHMFEEEVITPVAEISSLNGIHGFRNLMWQSEFIGFVKGDGGGGWEEPANTFVELFDRYYYGLLDLRRDSMRMVFEVLVQQKEIGGGGDYVLAETGTTFGSTGWMESGQSALLFDRFLNFPGVDGVLYSVDLDKESCSISRELCSDKVVVVNGDSVEYFELLDKELKEGGKKVDLIYLDSFDVSDDNWVGGEGGEEEPAGHALRELEALFGSLKRPGGVVLVDDNMIEGVSDVDVLRKIMWDRAAGEGLEYERGVDRVRGKGRKIVEWMEEERRGCDMFYYGWQVAWLC